MASSAAQPLQDQKALVTGWQLRHRRGERARPRPSGRGGRRELLLQASAADELVREIRDLGGEAVALKADVSRDDEVRTMFDRLVEAFGRIDILVANAGIQKDSAITDMSLEDWRAGRALVTTGSCTLRSATPTKTRVFARSAPRRASVPHQP